MRKCSLHETELVVITICDINRFIIATPIDLLLPQVIRNLEQPNSNKYPGIKLPPEAKGHIKKTLELLQKMK